MVFLLVFPLLILTIEILVRKKVSYKIWNVCSVLFIIALSHALGSRCISCMVYDDYANVYLYQGKFLAEFGFDRFESSVDGVTSEKLFYLIFYLIANLMAEIFLSIIFIHRVTNFFQCQRYIGNSFDFIIRIIYAINPSIFRLEFSFHDISHGKKSSVSIYRCCFILLYTSFDINFVFEIPFK